MRTVWQKGIGLLALVSLALGWWVGTAWGQQGTIVTDVEIVVLAGDWAALGVSSEEIPEDAAIVGDTIKVLATVEPQSTEASESFDVEFYYENIYTHEVGLIGSERVPGFAAAADGFLKPAVFWPQQKMIPGVYRIVLRGSFDIAQDVVDNPAQVTILQLGKYLEFTESPNIPSCLLDGGFEFSRTLGVVSLGTEPVGSADFEQAGGERYLEAYYKTPDSAFKQLPYKSCVISFFLGLDPGEVGTLVFTLRFPLDLPQVGIGDSTQVQVRLEGTGDVVMPELRLPSSRTFFRVSPWIELWTFPAVDVCSLTGIGEHVEGDAVEVAPAVSVGGSYKTYIPVWNASEGQSRLYSVTGRGGALQRNTSDAHVPWEVPGRITALHVAPDPEDNDSTWVFAAVTEGGIHTLHCLRDARTADGGEAYDEVWSEPFASSIDHAPCTFADAQSGLVVVVGTADGLFGHEVLSGDRLWSLSDEGSKPVTQPPIALGNTIWFASGSDGKTFSAYTAQGETATRVRRSTSNSRISTPLKTAAPLDYVFFGTEDGGLWAVRPTTTDTVWCRELTDWEITGLDVVSGGDLATTDVYATTRRPQLLWFGWENDNDCFEVKGGTDELTIGSPGAPTVVVSADGEPAAVVITTDTGRMVAYRPELDGVATATLWPPRLFSEWSDGDWNPAERPENDPIDFAFDLGIFQVPMTIAVLVDQPSKRLLIGAGNGYVYAFDVEWLD